MLSMKTWFRGHEGPSCGLPLSSNLPIQTRCPPFATKRGSFLAALLRIFSGIACKIWTSKTNSNSPLHSSGGLSKSATTHSIPLFSCLFFAHSTAVGERSNATTSQPCLSRKTASSPRPHPTTSARPGGLPIAYSTTNGLGEPSDHGIQLSSPFADEYSSSNQERGSLVDAAASDISFSLRLMSSTSR